MSIMFGDFAQGQREVPTHGDRLLVNDLLPRNFAGLIVASYRNFAGYPVVLFGARIGSFGDVER